MTTVAEPDTGRHLRVVDTPAPSRVMADVDAEKAVLGMMMSAPSNIEAASDTGLIGSDFWKPAHTRIWDTIIALWAAGQPTDPVSVAWELAEAGEIGRAGGTAYPHELYAAAPAATGTVAHHANIIRRCARRRRIREAGIKIVQASENLQVDVDDVAERAQQVIHESTVTRKTDMVSVAEFANDEFAYLEDVAAGKIESGISSGIRDLDDILGGWHPGRFIIPAGRPAMGKTLAMLGWALKAAELGWPVLIFPMEMNRREVFWRLLANKARVSLHFFQKARFASDDWDRLRAAKDYIRKLPITVDDQVNAMPQILANSRRFAQRNGRPGMIGVDYVQRLNFPGKERHDIEIGNAAKGLKGLSRELETTVFGVCQLNRGNEQRAEKIPQLSDLGDSGKLEQEADQVILLHRPEYYDKEHPRAGEADFIVAKNRHGPTDTVTVAAQLHYARFVDMAIA